MNIYLAIRVDRVLAVLGMMLSANKKDEYLN
jgi:hypothetical protein